ncbi:hypothetical protein L7F22_062435 [Adiantum nelumboides]|nr:hypothetical protein [Adiantum nelumboides]
MGRSKQDVKDIVRRLHADASSDGKDSREAIDALVDDLGGSASQSQGDASLSTHGEGSTHASGSSKSNVNSSKKRKVAQGVGGLPAAFGLQARKQADQALRRFFYAEDVPEWKLCDLYENDSIFDKFDCCPSGDGLRVTTGSYSNFFRVFGVMPGSDEAATLEASKHPTKRFSQTVTKPSRSLTSFGRRGKKATESSSIDTQIGDQDFKSKLLHMAWHPQSNLIACAALNSLYMYYA